MTDHPILFKADMVNAIRDGRKTQTRRIISPQPDTSRWKPEYANKPKEWRLMVRLGPVHHGYDPKLWCLHDTDSPVGAVPYTARLCPYGVPGDLLYVRENWWAVEVDKVGVQYCVFDDEFEIEALGGQYPAPDTLRLLDRQNWRYGRHPNIHLPKKQCRLWLRVKSVRVERVQEISYKDAFTEGVNTQQATHAVPYFKTLWDSINKDRGFGWDVNPWVWVVEFERHDK